MKRLYYYKVTALIKMGKGRYYVDKTSKYFETEQEADSAAVVREEDMKEDFGAVIRDIFHHVYADMVDDEYINTFMKGDTNHGSY